ncbi:MAG TPA: FKBP-type peptidyl-prolyl cis-trans isomerase [Terriglobales bacterium]|nr:FKBP-type peptidyl-prolyl cis-trans isomerase [Terriglobales bacterium]
MRKFHIAAVLLAAGAMLVANGSAQETPAAKPSTSSSAASKAPAKKATTASSAANAPLATRKEKFSYALGMNIANGLGGSLKSQGVEVDWNLVAQGLKDGAAGGKTRLTHDEAGAVLNEMQNEVRKEVVEKNKSEGEAFLAANKTKEGVKTTSSGLQYKVLVEGKGPKPTAEDTVVCNYKGALINGNEFDSSYKRGEPATFPVTGVIKGWTEALQMMPVGSKWQLFIPSSLAYGENVPPGASFGPDSTLIFEVELISIKPKEDNKAKEQPGKEEKK